MKLERRTYVKIGLILLLCVLVCGWLGGCARGCGRYSSWADRGVTLFPTGGLLGCMAMEAITDTFDEAVDEGLINVPSAPSAPAAPSAPTGPASPNVADGWGRGSFTVEADQVSAIELNWLAGDVSLRVAPDAETTALCVTETINGRAPELEWELNGGTLSINYMESSNGLSSCSSGWHGSKELEIVVPASLALSYFDLEAASGRYSIDGTGAADGALPCDAVELNVASGNVAISALSAQDLALSLASGEVSYTGSVSDRVDIEVASGRTTISTPSGAPKSIAASLASGHLEFNLAPNTVVVETVSKTSGSYSNQLKPAEAEGDPVECALDLDMMSGTCTVKAAG